VGASGSDWKWKNTLTALGTALEACALVLVLREVADPQRKLAEYLLTTHPVTSSARSWGQQRI